MASATSKVAPVTTYTGNAQQRRSGKGPRQKGFYKTQTTTLVGGGTKVETYRTDAKGNNAVKISESEVDAKGNVTKQETLSTASAAEKRALSNPDSRLSRSVKNQVEDTKKQLKDANVSNLDKAAGGSGNAATGSGEEESQPSAEPAKPAPGANKGIKGGTYPVDIGSTKQDIIKFDMLEYRPSKFEDNRPAVDTAKIIETVILAVPGGIQDQSNANWTAESMDPMQKAAAKAAFNIIGEGEQGVNQAIADAKSAFENGGGEMKQMVQGIFAGKAAGVGNQVFQRGMGQIMNPNMELLFNGPSVRQFSFNFLLAPRSKTEQDEVVNIIRFFKQGMSPTKSEQNMFLKSPNTFRLRYIHRKSGEDSEHKFLTKFKECALTSTGVNYTPNNNYATFPDGGMVAYQLALTFQELEPIFNNDYAKVEEGSIGY
tara:strand:- start:429 stop:1715 length:1287 start_codon:yes stop_codon:yes gene_type:complete